MLLFGTSGFSVRVDDGPAKAKFAAMLAAAKNPRAICAAGGRAMNAFLKRHFLKLQQTNPNKLGAKRQNFWINIRNSVQNPVITKTTAQVAVSDPRYPIRAYGGTVYAKRVKMLTIPVSKDAYGRSAAVLEREKGIKLVAISHGGRGVLAEVLLGAVVIVHYILKPSVYIPPTPGTLPDHDAMTADALHHCEAAAARQMGEAA